MQREINKTVLALAMVLMAVVVVTTVRPSKVRAADEKYQLVENWAQLPPGMQWGVMSAVDIDSHGTIYAFKRSEPGEKAGAMSSMVMVIDPNGKFLRSWGEHTFMSAHGLRVLRDGFIWITDKTGDQVFKYSPDGELLMTLGKKGVAGDNDSTDALNGPSDVVIGKNGDIFVSDGESTNTRVVKFSKDGKFIKCWGTKGAGPGSSTFRTTLRWIRRADCMWPTARTSAFKCSIRTGNTWIKWRSLERPPRYLLPRTTCFMWLLARPRTD